MSAGSTAAAARAAPARRALALPPRWARGIKGALGLALFVLAWQLSVPLVGLPEYFYPSPSRVAGAALELIEKGILPVYLADSLLRYLGSVAVGIALGVAVGLAIGLSRTAATALGPVVNFLYAIVESAWIPLFVIWWGYGLKVIVVLLVYIVFFPMLYNTMVGVRSVPPAYINAVRALGATRWQVLREVILPAALPNLITGVRVGAGFAFRGLIFAEMLTAKTGIGYLIYEGVSSQNTARTVVGMICTGLLWLVIDRAYLRPFEAATVERWGVLTRAEARE